MATAEADGFLQVLAQDLVGALVADVHGPVPLETAIAWIDDPGLADAVRALVESGAVDGIARGALDDATRGFVTRKPSGGVSMLEIRTGRKTT